MAAPHRTGIAVSVTLTIVFFAILCGFANYFAFRHNKIWDVSESGIYSLSDKTRNVIRGLSRDKPVRLTLLFNRQDPLYDRIRPLLERYADDSGGRVKLDVVGFHDPSRVERVVKQYKIAAGQDPETGQVVTEDVVVVEFDGRHKVISKTSLADFTPPNPMTGDMGGKVRAFKGEEKVTAAIVSLVQGKPARLYFVTGHGEGDLTAQTRSGFMELGERIKRENIDVAPLNLLEAQEIPQDASALVILGPTQPYTTNEVQLIQKWVADKGRLFVALDPGTDPGLGALLADYGVKARQDVVFVNLQLLGLSMRIPINDYGNHPIVNPLRSGNITLMFANSLSLQLLDPKPGQTSAPVELVKSPAQAWGETDLAGGEDVKFDSARDTKGPLTLAVALDTGKVGDGKVNLDGSRVVITGSASMYSNGQMPRIPGATDFFLNSINWLLKQETVLGIAPKTPIERTLSLTSSQMVTLGVALAAVPLSVLALGVLVWSRRRA
jgi:ABC-type uncharacterized transport system involved in gliding motility auxiliary subunit